ncbi:cytochrome P450 [Hyaloscypha variabilis F]|uniref:Cytochrome P450 n=1 Tax=Hyaloscypha variabilis (strain UAMH 11265 / GT02V1 / F) TaxID=1149755 RepID=A0A2J6R081_HYAVF|nr:cytochrome P450 [Hyaloscypha variabilis F]
MLLSHITLTPAWEWAWVLLPVLVTYAVFSRVRTWLRLRHIPGPPLVGWSKAWLLRKSLGGQFHLDTAEACEKYGPIVRIGPNELVTNDPNVLRRMSAVRSLYTRSEWYDGMRLEPEYDSMFSERNEERHNMLRSKAAMAYSGKDNKYLEKSIDDNIAKLVRLLDSKYASTTGFTPVDMAEKFQLLTLDIISEIAFGDAFGNLESDEDVSSYVETMENMFPLVILLGTWPALAKLFFWKPLRRFLPKETDAAGMGKFMGIGKKVVAERFGPDKKIKQDMIGSLLAHGLSQREVQTETLLQIVAGSDPPATAMRATLLYIITSSNVLSKLLSEISTADISNPITDAEARRLPYLQAVIKEGMRVFPPNTGFMSKTVPSEGDTINGIFIPGGTTIGWSPFGLMRSKKIWGADAKLFRPERWFEGSPEDRQRKDIEFEMCFGYGKYQCIGKNIAIIELNKAYVELLRNFEFTLVDPVIPWKGFNAGLFIHSDLWMKVTKRVPSL